MDTLFFHAWATRRNKRKKIEGLFNSDSVWVKDLSDVCGLAKDYFLSLFKYETGGNFERILDQISRCISPEMTLLLDEPVTNREIFEAFNQMDPRKAPSIDGLRDLFYKENLDVLNKKVIQYCHEILKEDCDPMDINETVMVFIQKINEPKDITHFRPINLCQVEWDFLEKVMLQMGFSVYWVRKVMRCVQLNGPHINHLFFADNAFLFVRNKKEEVKEVLKIFHEFEKDSGQNVNLTKSVVYFSPKTLRSQRQILSKMLVMCVLETMENYLGLLLTIGKKKTEAFQHILDHFLNKINGWSKRLLSYGGKDVFVKSVLKYLPPYALSVFLTPRGTIDDMISKMRSYWRASHDLLPTNVKISSIKQNVGQGCLRCGSGDETTIHALKECPKAYEILSFGGIDGRLLDIEFELCIDWLEVSKCVLDRKRFKILLWSFGTYGVVKIMLSSMVKRLEDFVLGGRAGVKGNHMSVKWAKLDALIKGITMACFYNFDKIIFESNYVNLVNCFRKNQEDITILGHKIKDTRGMLEIFTSAEVKWIGRNRNKMANSLCNLALSNHYNLTFDMEYPSDIHNCIILDSL
ncbi:hypothetical protein PVK06_011800 [Gossypium arboreum]|uniref:RNase H type-1 domain-containing protein n=1 Tax=Gossypium arboreum TaxID=29729 RepID=A0ABR0QA22_GOSAR|nr:hypothetical protein PVK06_011800 [Gossypium arboreum]